MSLRLSYTLLAPFYDLVAKPAFAKAREKNLRLLPRGSPCNVLLSGVGTGLDLPYLPACHRYTGLDITHAMLERAMPRATDLNIGWIQGDSQALPFKDACFDHAVLHLILAVVPDPAKALQEAARTLKPGGTILIFDKFLRPGARAPLRRLLSPLAAGIATRTDVVFEEVLKKTPGLQVIGNEPALVGGWFRFIRLQKRAA
jgi:phosphatidylethanolamine/phosphatidyl-N-methylethanolamine N-methyltransferase